MGFRTWATCWVIACWQGANSIWNELHLIVHLCQRKPLISDIHGNLEAFQAVLSDIESQEIETIFCLGDIIGYGPNPRECIDLCMSMELCILGNHDLAALFDPEGFSRNAEDAIFWTRSQLEDPTDGKAKERWQFLAERPRTFRDEEFMFVHGSARAPLSEYVFPEDIHNQRKIEKIFDLIQKYCFQGHTHVPGVFVEGAGFHSPETIDSRFELASDKVMVNVGSVGQPRDGNPLACYVVLDGKQIEFRRVDYDREVTRQKIHDIPPLDNSLGDRLLDGR